MPMHEDAQLKVEVNRMMSIRWLSFPEMYTSVYAAILSYVIAQLTDNLELGSGITQHHKCAFVEG